MSPRQPTIRAVILDLDGVVTDTAELHYQAWKRLADEEGIPFDRKVNEQLRGVSRQRSLQIILGDRKVPPERFNEMTERKNRYYQELLEGITPADLLPGALELLHELRRAGIKVAIGSASKNARAVVERLGLSGEIDALADGHCAERTKPAPDLFLAAAEMLGVPPHECLVVEDAAAGVTAALLAGMWAVGLGPTERVGHAHAIFPSLDGVSWPRITEALASSPSARPDHDDARWAIVEETFEPERLNHKETVFTIGNGYLGIRGALEESHPGEQRAAFVHGVFDAVPTYFSELANIPDFLGLELLVEGERLSLERGELLAWRRTLNLRNGVLTRRLTWRSPRGQTIELACERFASMANECLVFVRWEVRPLDFDGEIELRASLHADAENLGTLHWTPLAQGRDGAAAWLLSQTRASRIRLAQAMRLEVDGQPASEFWDTRGQPTLVARKRLGRNQSLVATKTVALATSRECPDPLGEAIAALDAAGDYHREFQRNACEWNKLWAVADIVIEGDERAQQAVRFNIFQLLVAAPRRDLDSSIGARTLSGFGYRGHVFWDTEIFVLPLFTYTLPEVARNLLLYRARRLDGARRKAKACGCRGAQFPWESAETGDEVTPPWLPHPEDPARLVRVWTGDLQIHITADIAYAVWQYWLATGDDAFMADHGAEVVLDGANFWVSRAERDPDGSCHIRNVIGPDEYHTHIGDNAYTNALARWQLLRAVEVLDWLRENYPQASERLACRLDLDPGLWREVADRLHVPQPRPDGLIEQFPGFFDLEPIDWAALEPRKLSVQDALGLERTNQLRVLKQPDVLMLFCLFPEAYDRRAVQANWDYYEPLTDHLFGSSLGPAVHALVAARLGMVEVAYEHFVRAALVDLEDTRGNAAQGIHAASAGGVWQAVVFGFAGLRLTPDGPKTDPHLPPTWRRLVFQVVHRGQLHRIELCERPSSQAALKTQGRAHTLAGE